MKLYIRKIDLSKCQLDDILITSSNKTLKYKYKVEIDNIYMHVLLYIDTKNTITIWNTQGICINDGYPGEGNCRLGHIIQIIPKELYEVNNSTIY